MMEMTNKKKERLMLADDLTEYIRGEHTQEECIGFSDGYKAALSKLKNLGVIVDVIVSPPNVCTDTGEECKYKCSGLCKERC